MKTFSSELNLNEQLLCYRNSPYVITVKTLSLEEEDGAYVKMSDINDNVYKSMKKSVKFDVQYFEI